MTKIGATRPSVKKRAPKRGVSPMSEKPVVQKNRTTVVSRPAKTASANALIQAPARGNTRFMSPPLGRSPRSTSVLRLVASNLSNPRGGYAPSVSSSPARAQLLETSSAAAPDHHPRKSRERVVLPPPDLDFETVA